MWSTWFAGRLRYFRFGQLATSLKRNVPLTLQAVDHEPPQEGGGFHRWAHDFSEADGGLPFQFADVNGMMVDVTAVGLIPFAHVHTLREFRAKGRK